jgi:hypothetical protein
MLLFVVFALLGCAAILGVWFSRLPAAAPIRLDRRVQSEAGTPDTRSELNDSRAWDGHGYGYRNC